MFPNSVGKPICTAKLVRDVIRPAFLKWDFDGTAGKLTFRRGLATNLHHLGVPDKTIQAILRHSNVAVTQSCYIKTVRSDAAEAMQLLEAAATAKASPSSALHSRKPVIFIVPRPRPAQEVCFAFWALCSSFTVALTCFSDKNVVS